MKSGLEIRDNHDLQTDVDRKRSFTESLMKRMSWTMSSGRRRESMSWRLGFVILRVAMEFISEVLGTEFAN